MEYALPKPFSNQYLSGDLNNTELKPIDEFATTNSILAVL